MAKAWLESRDFEFVSRQERAQTAIAYALLAIAEAIEKKVKEE